jgi:hypothetical protein
LPGQQPGRRAFNAVSAAHHLSLRYGCHSSVIGKGSVQRGEIRARLTRVPVNHGGILEVFVKDEVRFKEASV